VWLAAIILAGAGGTGIGLATQHDGRPADRLPATATGCIVAVKAEHVSLAVWDYCTAMDRHGDHPRLNAALWANFERVTSEWRSSR
jgi:hypothetical protein